MFFYKTTNVVYKKVLKYRVFSSKIFRYVLQIVEVKVLFKAENFYNSTKVVKIKEKVKLQLFLHVIIM